jgi:hypothetical protein
MWSATCTGVHDGRCFTTMAATPLTSGAENEVPSALTYELAEEVPGPTISTPGATTDTWSPHEENRATWPASSLAPTATTPGTVAA